MSSSTIFKELILRYGFNEIKNDLFILEHDLWEY